MAFLDFGDVGQEEQDVSIEGLYSGRDEHLDDREIQQLSRFWRGHDPAPACSVRPAARWAEETVPITPAPTMSIFTAPSDGPVQRLSTTLSALVSLARAKTS